MVASEPGANQPKSPTWSADGKQIVISMQAGGTLTDTYMCIVNGKPTEVKQWNNAAPAWSPDGKQIAFVTDRNGAYEIWVMNAGGSNQHVLVSAATLASLGQTLQYQGQDERVISWR